MKKRVLVCLLVLTALMLCVPYAAAETIHYQNGDVYMGEVVNGRPHGIGVYLLVSGNMYRGEFAEGCFHGKGVYSWPDGSHYIGDFVMDSIEGEGVLTLDNGEYYIGAFRNNACHGYGTTYAADGTVLETGLYVSGTFIGISEEKKAADFTEEDVLGVWVCRSVKIGEVSIGAEQIGIDAEMTFMADGSVSLRFDDETEYDTWHIENGMIVLSQQEIALADGELHVIIDEGEIFFARPDAV